MGRAVLDAAGLFSLPFLGYALLLVLSRRYPLVADSWSRGSLAKLAMAGLLLVVAGLLVVGTASDRRKGIYVPARIDNGVLVPGHIQ